MILNRLLIVDALHVQMEYYFTEQYDVQITDFARNFAYFSSKSECNIQVFALHNAKEKSAE